VRFKICLIAALAASAACGGDAATTSNVSPPLTPQARQLTRAEEVAIDESVEQGEDDEDPGDRAAARKAAAEFAAKLLPSWEVLGIHSRLLGKLEYRVMVDVEKGKRRETLDLTVVRFYPEDAEPYWKVRPMTISLDRALLESNEVERIRELNRLKSEPE